MGTASRAYVPGRYSLMEDMVHAFDLMVADGYADDGVITRFAPRHDKWADARRGRAALPSDGSPEPLARRKALGSFSQRLVHLLEALARARQPQQRVERGRAGR